MDNVYSFMTKWGGTNLGQVFTPEHIALFAAKLLDIHDGDVVVDSSAGSGALLMMAVHMGAKEVYGVEYEESIYNLLENNLRQIDNIKYEVICDDARNDRTKDFISSKPITKCILNPPYEKKYGCYEILLNTLNSLPVGTKVALFFPVAHLTKLNKSQAKEMERHRVEKIIKLPPNTFQPFASVETSLYLITAGVPQGCFKPWGCEIVEDGLVRKKNKYRVDSKGKWRNEIEPYWYKVITTGKGDASVVEELESLSYQKPIRVEDRMPTTEDFEKTIGDYMDFKIKRILKDYGWDEAQQRLVALAFLVGRENVLDAMSHPEKYIKKK